MADIKELAIKAWQTREREREQEELRAAQERIPEVRERFQETFGISVEDAKGELLIMDGKVFINFTDFMVRPDSLDGFAVFLPHPNEGMVRVLKNAHNLADLGEILANPPEFIAKDSWYYEAYWTPPQQNNDTRPFCPLLSMHDSNWQQCRDDCAWWSAAGCGLIISNLG